MVLSFLEQHLSKRKAPTGVEFVLDTKRAVFVTLNMMDELSVGQDDEQFCMGETSNVEEALGTADMDNEYEEWIQWNLKHRCMMIGKK